MRAALAAGLFLAVLSIQLTQGQASKPKVHPEIKLQRPECGIFLPEWDERHDLARLIRADQFLTCERDGFQKSLAPPWKSADEGEKKLGNACEYFGAESARDYPQVSEATLTLAADRCRINVMQVILSKMFEGLSQPR